MISCRYEVTKKNTIPCRLQYLAQEITNYISQFTTGVQDISYLDFYQKSLTVYKRHTGQNGARGGAVGWGTALLAGRSRVRFPMVSLEFFIDIILPAALWSCGWLSLQQKWMSGIFPGGKDGQSLGLTTLPPSCADCLEIWEPQPPGNLRPCPSLQWDCFMEHNEMMTGVKRSIRRKICSSPTLPTTNPAWTALE